MARIPFNIEFRPQIESGEYKVETRDGMTARIICWDRRGERPLVVLVQNLNGYDEGLFYYENGLANGVGQESDGDLFIVIPEPELMEFEKSLADVIGYAADDKGFLTSKRIIGDKEAVELQEYLKSLSPVNQEWSKEDKNRHYYLCKILRETWDKVDKGSCIDDAITWFEELPKRISPPSWKPSEYTLSLVKKVADGEMLAAVEQMAMGTLHNDLQKLL